MYSNSIFISHITTYISHRKSSMPSRIQVSLFSHEDVFPGFVYWLVRYSTTGSGSHSLGHHHHSHHYSEQCMEVRHIHTYFISVRSTVRQWIMGLLSSNNYDIDLGLEWRISLTGHATVPSGYPTDIHFQNFTSNFIRIFSGICAYAMHPNTYLTHQFFNWTNV